MFIAESGEQIDNTEICESTEVCGGRPYPVMDKTSVQGMGYICTKSRVICQEHHEESDSGSSEESENSSSEHPERNGRHRLPHNFPANTNDDVTNEEVSVREPGTSHFNRRPSRRNNNYGSRLDY